MKLKINKARLMMKLLTAFLIITIVPVSALGYITYNNAKDTLRKEAEEKLKVILDSTVDKISIKMDKIKDTGYIIGDIPLLANYITQSQNQKEDDEGFNQVIGTIRQLKNTLSGISDGILIINNNGEVLIDETNGVNSEINVSNERYFKESMSGNIYWSKVVISKSSEEPISVYSMPIKNNNQAIIGVIAIKVNVNSLTNQLRNIELGKSGYGYMVDKSGNIIYHPDKNKIMKENLLNSGNEGLKKQVTKMTNGEEDKGFYTYEGVYELNMYKPIGNWSVAINIPVDEYMKDAEKIKKIALYIAVGSIIIGILIATFVSRQITRPVNIMMDLMKRAEDGDLTVKADIKSKDEVGDLATSFNNMIKGQNKAMLEVLKAAKQVGSSAQEASSVSEEMAASSESQTQSINEMTIGINDMGKSITEVTESISSMATDINTTKNNTEELGQAANEVAKSAQETSETITNVTSSIKQIDTSIDVVAENAKEASKKADNTVKVAQKGKATVNKTINEMDNIDNAMDNLTVVIKGLGKAAIQIGDIVEVIDDIAEQTNLLALNASIEAARAGEHGKGFAVVASAIGDLAEESGNATKDITKLIKKIQEQVNDAVNTTDEGASQVANGVKLVKNTGYALDEIFKAIDDTTDLIKEIASSTSEQSQASKSVMEAVEKINGLSMEVSSAVEEQVASIDNVIEAVKNIDYSSQEIASASEEQSASVEELVATADSIDEMSNQVSAASEEVASTSQELSDAAEKLNKLVEKFKI
ncbi:methyl-accepting chemotaxis protein [Dethiothermospora halolimnae]|uniref:methyl-accepting chemotaxis protein n=1 Tax=Dethiothermospora halolimnae TaxID=3114390 RepID=UPI003CCC0714